MQKAAYHMERRSPYSAAAHLFPQDLPGEVAEVTNRLGFGRPTDLQMTEEQRAELDRRLGDPDPGSLIPWEQVRVELDGGCCTMPEDTIAAGVREARAQLLEAAGGSVEGLVRLLGPVNGRQAATPVQVPPQPAGPNASPEGRDVETLLLPGHRFSLYRPRRPTRCRVEGGLPGVVFDLDDRGTLVGIDIDHASRQLDLPSLEATSIPFERSPVNPDAPAFRPQPSLCPAIRDASQSHHTA